MYTYYFCAAMRWPFPRAVKRNLTTMQIAQIASGTFLTNLYLLIKLDPTAVLNAYKANKVSSWFQPVATHDQLVFIHALSRAASSEPTTCMQTTGAEIALHLNTMYMFVSITTPAHHRIHSAEGQKLTRSLICTPLSIYSLCLCSSSTSSCALTFQSRPAPRTSISRKLSELSMEKRSSLFSCQLNTRDMVQPSSSSTVQVRRL